MRITCTDSVARSRAVVFCSGWNPPQEFLNTVRVMPNWRARAVISAAKTSSVPRMPSPSAIAASLPDWMMMPRRRSITRTRLLSCANMLEPPDGAPPRRHAFSEITMVSSGLRLPSAIALKASSAVITFTIEAGDIRSSAFFSNRTLPESASTRMAKGALVVIVCARAGARADKTRAAATHRTRFVPSMRFPDPAGAKVRSATL